MASVATGLRPGQTAAASEGGDHAAGRLSRMRPRLSQPRFILLDEEFVRAPVHLEGSAGRRDLQQAHLRDRLGIAGLLVVAAAASGSGWYRSAPSRSVEEPATRSVATTAPTGGFRGGGVIRGHAGVRATA